jgi:hypothetical protein
MVINAIAEQLLQEIGSPYLTEKHMRDRYAKQLEVPDTEPESDDDLARGVRINLRENDKSKEWWRVEACPAELLKGALEAVQKTVGRSSRRGALQPLPLYIKDVGATPSTKKEQRERWLQSEDAMDWNAARIDLFRGCSI